MNRIAVNRVQNYIFLSCNFVFSFSSSSSSVCFAFEFGFGVFVWANGKWQISRFSCGFHFISLCTLSMKITPLYQFERSNRCEWLTFSKIPDIPIWTQNMICGNQSKQILVVLGRSLPGYEHIRIIIHKWLIINIICGRNHRNGSGLKWIFLQIPGGIAIIMMLYWSGVSSKSVATI